MNDVIRKRVAFRAALVLLGTLVLPLEAPRASQVRPVNLAEMVDHAARIFSGRCIRVERATDAATGRAVDRVTFRIQRPVKGVDGAELTVTLLAGTDAQAFGGAPSFAEGEEVVVFLYADSAAGLTSPVGMAQGKFRVIEDKLGRRVAVNGFGNRGLLERLPLPPGSPLRASVAALEREPAPEPDRLLDLVESLSGAAAE